ncbi:MAG: response regulator transcription factor [Rhizomicrobium sp.]
MSTPQSTEPIRLLVVDDHPMLRQGIASLLQSEPDLALAGEAATGGEAIELFRALRPDVTLMDIQLPDMDGTEAIRRIREEFPAARLLVLTTYSGDVQVLRALKSGAAGYLLKSALRKDLLDAIRTVHAGGRRLPPDIAMKIAEHAGDDALSGREVEILRLVATGRTNKQIAEKLSIAEETVKTHIKSILSKLGVTDRTQAVTTALKRGIIEL